MKLIDLLVKELPKRGGWPDGAEYARVSGFGVLSVRLDCVAMMVSGFSFAVLVLIAALHLVGQGKKPPPSVKEVMNSAHYALNQKRSAKLQ